MPERVSPVPPAEVRRIRKRLGMTLAQFAKLVHVHWNTVAKWESGLIGRRPSTDALIIDLAEKARIKVGTGKSAKKRSKAETKTVTTEMLLRGAFYALQECGRKLGSAALLIEAKRYPDGAALALLAREELGRHK